MMTNGRPDPVSISRSADEVVVEPWIIEWRIHVVTGDEHKLRAGAPEVLQAVPEQGADPAKLALRVRRVAGHCLSIVQVGDKADFHTTCPR